MNHLNMRNFPVVTFLALVLLALSSFTTRAASEEYPEDIAARVQQKFDRMTSLSFTFNQKSQGQVSGRPRTGSGTALFYKAGKTSRMRWDYTAPDRQVLISDGKTFSMYFAELQQMIVTPAESLESDLTYTFFSGTSRISDKFHILPPDPEVQEREAASDTIRVIKLVPREPQSQVQSIHLWVDPDSFIRRIELRDHFDTQTQLTISGIEVDTLKDGDKAITALFAFTPPQGTEIIHQ